MVCSTLQHGKEHIISARRPLDYHRGGESHDEKRKTVARIAFPHVVEAVVTDAKLHQLVMIARQQRALMHLALLALQGAGEEIRSEEHTSELQSLMRISYAVLCLKK